MVKVEDAFVGLDSVGGLAQKLSAGGVDLTKWGQGKAKTVDHLLKEIAGGETILVQGQNGGLKRQVNTATIDVFFQDPADGSVLKLIEERQEFKDGRTRQRNLGWSVGEKIKAGEDPLETAIRGIKEELGVEGSVEIAPTGRFTENIDSPSFPGLKTEYNVSRYEVTLNGEQFNPAGYVEEQPDKKTIFVWKKVKE